VKSDYFLLQNSFIMQQFLCFGHKTPTQARMLSYLSKIVKYFFSIGIKIILAAGTHFCVPAADNIVN